MEPSANATDADDMNGLVVVACVKLGLVVATLANSSLLTLASFSFAGGTCLLGVGGAADADADADMDEEEAPAAAAAYFNGGNVGAAGLGRPALSTEAIGA